MAATVDVTIFMEVFGLAQDPKFISKKTDGTTPTETTYNLRTLGTADADEVLDLGGITTISMLAIRAIDFDLDVDLDYVSAFDGDLTVKAGEPAALIPNPAGVVRVKNNSAGESPSYEFLVVGT